MQITFLSELELEIFLSDVSETNPNTYPNRGYNDPDYIDFGRNLNHGYYFVELETFWLNGWLFTVLRPAQEFFHLLPVKDFKI
jgi:hypothetical protein